MQMPECVDVESSCHAVQAMAVLSLYFDVITAALYLSFFFDAFEYKMKQAPNMY